MAHKSLKWHKVFYGAKQGRTLTYQGFQGSPGSIFPAFFTTQNRAGLAHEGSTPSFGTIEILIFFGRSFIEENINTAVPLYPNHRNLVLNRPSPAICANGPGDQNSGVSQEQCRKGGARAPPWTIFTRNSKKQFVIPYTPLQILGR